MLFVTTVSGDSHREMARQMQRSFKEWGWPDLIIADAKDHPDYDDLWGGRGLKTRFAYFVPDWYKGPVAWVDADCIATGPYKPLPTLGENAMAGLVMYRGRDDQGRATNLMTSTVLVLPSVEIAREICNGWYQALKTEEQPEETDEKALRVVTKYRNAISTGWYQEPLPNLKHLATTHPWKQKQPHS